MKRTIKQLLHELGIDIVKYKKNRKSKKSKRLTFYKTKTGNYYLPTDAYEDTVANTIINNHIFDQEVVNYASKFIKPNTTVLDVGSNFGQMSFLFSELAGENGTVHAFDADDWIYEILVKNIEANSKVGRIIPHFGAVHNTAGETLFFPDQDFERFGTYGSYGIDFNAVKGRQVKTITIDSLKIEEEISFMKIDIQGGDLFAMKGAKKTIERNRMPIIFEYEYLFEEQFNMCFQDYVDFVHSINYKFHKVIGGHNFLIVPK